MCPLMRADGSVRLEAGYDPVTRVWNASTVDMPAIPDKPTKAQAKKSLGRIGALLAGFSLVDAVDRSACLSAIMTAVLRASMDLAPLHFLRAHTAGEGKSFLADLIAAFATGRGMCPVSAASYSDDETDKRLASQLLAGDAIVSIDNLVRDLKDTPLLYQILTQVLIKPRILGKSETPECENRMMMLATGNNVSVVGDLARRTITCNLDSGIENPERREFDFNPIDAVLDDRGSFIADVMTIARAYKTAGRSERSSIASFDMWSELVREPLIWLGEADPVESIERAKEEDPVRTTLAAVVDAWRSLGERCRELSATELAHAATTRISHDPDLYNALMQAAGAGTGDAEYVNTKRLGWWLKRNVGKVCQGCKIVKVGARLWRLVVDGP